MPRTRRSDLPAVFLTAAYLYSTRGSASPGTEPEEFGERKLLPSELSCSLMGVYVARIDAGLGMPRNAGEEQRRRSDSPARQSHSQKAGDFDVIFDALRREGSPRCRHRATVVELVVCSTIEGFRKAVTRHA